MPITVSKPRKRAGHFRYNHVSYSLDNLPDECPYCYKSITPRPHSAHHNEADDTHEVFMSCPDLDCNKSFVGYYELESEHLSTIKLKYSYDTSGGYADEEEFSEVIENISEKFVKIFNQAFEAEQSDLDEICGTGYRRALEFLIKDYIIKKNPSLKTKVGQTPLANCIEHHINNDRIKQVAKRATWLGNDETHYLKSFTDRDVTHLKDLIELTVLWIEMEEKTAKYVDEMPEKKKNKN